MPTVDDVYAGYAGVRGQKIREVRSLVLDVANTTSGVGEIEECLKWGQPSFVTKNPKSGSTIRVDTVRGSNDEYALFFICNTNLVEQFRELYPGIFNFSGNRALIFNTAETLPREELRHCVAKALTYHL